MHDDVRGLIEYAAGIAGNFHAPGSVGSSDNLAEVAAHFGRVVVDGADDVNGLLFAEKFSDGGPDGPDSILDGTNFLFHGQLRSSWLAGLQRGNSRQAN